MNAEELVRSLQAIENQSFDDANSRRQVAKAARSLFMRLEAPYERFQRYGYHEVCTSPIDVRAKLMEMNQSQYRSDHQHRQR